jgi:hypothetical protein
MNIVSTNPQPPIGEMPVHPEEMKATSEIRIGKWVSIQSTARITPAGVISTGIAISLVALTFGYLASRRRRW